MRLGTIVTTIRARLPWRRRTRRVVDLGSYGHWELIGGEWRFIPRERTLIDRYRDQGLM